MPPSTDPDTPRWTQPDADALGQMILRLTNDVAAARAAGIRNGPTEQWRDALAVCWLRQQIRPDAQRCPECGIS